MNRSGMNPKNTFWSAFTAGMGFAFARWVRKTAPIIFGLFLIGSLWILFDILHYFGIIT